MGVWFGITVAVMKDHEQKQLGEERFFFNYSSGEQLLIKGNEGRNPDRAGT